MTTVATGQVLLAGPSPAGLAASFAAPSGLPARRYGYLSVGWLTPVQIPSPGPGENSSGYRSLLNNREAGEGSFLNGIVGHVAIIGVAVDGEVQRLAWNGFQMTREALG
jgi:hypothetical protein